MWYAIAITAAVAFVTLIGAMYYCCKKENVIKLKPAKDAFSA